MFVWKFANRMYVNINFERCALFDFFAALLALPYWKTFLRLVKIYESLNLCDLCVLFKKCQATPAWKGFCVTGLFCHVCAAFVLFLRLVQSTFLFICTLNVFLRYIFCWKCLFTSNIMGLI